MSDFQTIKARDKKYFMNTYSPVDIAFEKGKGCYLTDSEGKTYLDFLAGIAVNCLGYDHPVFTNALTEQAHKVAVVSNYFYSEARGLMAEVLMRGTHLNKAFFGNSGAEANECAIKLARKYFYQRGENKYKIVSALHSFHGRTLATVTATGQEQYNKPFSPLPGGIGIYVPFNDIAALEKALSDPEVAAFMVEPIQCEGGIVPATKEYLEKARELLEKSGASEPLFHAIKLLEGDELEVKNHADEAKLLAEVKKQYSEKADSADEKWFKSLLKATRALDEHMNEAPADVVGAALVDLPDLEGLSEDVVTAIESELGGDKIENLPRKWLILNEITKKKIVELIENKNE